VLWWLRYSTCSPHKSPPGPHNFFGFAGTIVQANLPTGQRPPTEPRLAFLKS
jgi:hypothetical protein